MRTPTLGDGPIGDETLALDADARDIADALTGDGEAYRRLVERYQAEIGRQMHRFSRDPARRDELTHDVFVEAYLSLRTYKRSAPWIHWLRKIAVRVGYRHWTREKTEARTSRIDEASLRELPSTGSADEPAKEATEWVTAVLERLPPKDRLILSLLYVDGCSMAEAAERAGWTVIGAKLRAFRARNRLRRLLEELPP